MQEVRAYVSFMILAQLRVGWERDTYGPFEMPQLSFNASVSPTYHSSVCSIALVRVHNLFFSLPSA